MADKPKIYVESCCFIDAAKYQDLSKVPADKYDDVIYIREILKAAENGDILVYTSTLTIAECQHTGDHPPNDEVKRLFKSILTSGKIVQLIADSIFIAERARDLRWDYDITLRGADAIHVASAIEQGCEEFITSDGKGPLKNAPKIAKQGLRVIRPAETRLLPGQYKKAQQSLFPPVVPQAASPVVHSTPSVVSKPDDKAEDKNTSAVLNTDVVSVPPNKPKTNG